MRRIIFALAFAVLPGAALAQQVPQPLPQPVPLMGRDTLPVPPVVLLLPSPESRAEAVLAGTLEGAAVGAVYGAVLADQRPDCAPSTSPGGSATQGAMFGGVWGGLRGLLGRRHARVRTVVSGDRLPRATPRPNPDHGTPVPPLASDRCLASPPHSAGDAR